MKRGRGEILFCLVLILFLSGIICASIEIGNLSENIKTTYGQSETLSGWINISILKENADLLLNDSFGNKIKIGELLQINKETQSLQYNCSIANCSKMEYSSSNPEESKTFNMRSGEEVIKGIRFFGTNVDSISAKFSLESNAQTSCTNQIEVSVGDGSFKTQNYKINSISCENSLNYGCFDNSISTNFLGLNSSYLYCQKMNLSSYPGLKIGAWMIKKSSTDNVTMLLKDSSRMDVASCSIKNSEISNEGGEVGCQINYSIITPKNYYVCVTKEKDTSGSIEIQGYFGGDSIKCGYYDGPSNKSTAKEISSYRLFSEGKMYDSIGLMAIENNLSSQNMGLAIKNYISSTYGQVNKKINCPEEGCIVPIKIKSKVSQTVTINNLTVNYKTDQGAIAPEDNFYDISSSSPIISTNGFVQIYLDGANFSVTGKTGSQKIVLKLGDTTIASKNITIQSIPTISYIFPLTTSSAYPTTFTVYANASSGNITDYIWEFNDGTSILTKENKVKHTFNETKIYTVKVTVKDTLSRNASKEFEIKVESPEKTIQEKYKELKGYFDYIQSQKSAYSKFLGDQIVKALNLTTVSDDLNRYSAKISAINGSTLEEKNQLLTDLLNLRIPKYLTESYVIENLTFFPAKEAIDLGILKTIGAGSYDETKIEEYKEAILFWQQQNIEVKLKYKEISSVYEEGTLHTLSFFEVRFIPKGSSSPYFFLKKIPNLEFEGQPIIQQNPDYYYLELRNEPTSFVFSTTESVNFLNLPLFVSPVLTQISLNEKPSDPIELSEKINWVLFSLAVFFVLVLGFIVYIILQEWYKNKYENYLFKGKNNMYNLINFIEAQKKQGIDEKEIEHKLKQSGWNWEQINYVARKYSGKRTGMIEIPITRIFEKNSIAPRPQEYPNKPVFQTKTNSYVNPQKKNFFRK